MITMMIVNSMEDSIILSRKALRLVDNLQAQAEMFDMDIDWELMELVPKHTPPKSHWPNIWDDERQINYYSDNMNSEEWERKHGE